MVERPAVTTFLTSGLLLSASIWMTNFTLLQLLLHWWHHATCDKQNVMQVCVLPPQTSRSHFSPSDNVISLPPEVDVVSHSQVTHVTEGLALPVWQLLIQSHAGTLLCFPFQHRSDCWLYLCSISDGKAKTNLSFQTGFVQSDLKQTVLAYSMYFYSWLHVSDRCSVFNAFFSMWTSAEAFHAN